MNPRGQIGFAIFLLASRLTPSLATVLVYVPSSSGPAQSPTRFEDVPAMSNLGPRISSRGFSGRLQIAKPDIYGCSALDGPVAASKSEAAQTEPPALPNSDQERPYRAAVVSGRHEVFADQESVQADASTEELPTAVLISRSVKGDSASCTFEAKVLNAQAAGYSMVVVYDSLQENMFKMGAASDNGTPRPTVDIPLVLVTHASGLALTALIAASSDARGPEIFVDNADPYVGMFVTVNLTMFMLVTGFMLALLTCGSMLVLTLHRYLRRYEDLVAGTSRPMSLPEVLELPEVEVEAGSRLEGDSCPVCLEAYRIGDKLRSLPCDHAFHAGCITPWLTERQRTCPMCKAPVTARSSCPSQTPPAAVDTSDGAQVTSSPSRPTAPFAGTGRLGRMLARSNSGGRWGSGARLPLLSNPRGGRSDGGSTQETPPV